MGVEKVGCHSDITTNKQHKSQEHSQGEGIFPTEPSSHGRSQIAKNFDAVHHDLYALYGQIGKLIGEVK